MKLKNPATYKKLGSIAERSVIDLSTTARQCTTKRPKKLVVAIDQEGLVTFRDPETSRLPNQLASEAFLANNHRLFSPPH